jgi:hypothetical protein
MAGTSSDLLAGAALLYVATHFVLYLLPFGGPWRGSRLISASSTICFIIFRPSCGLSLPPRSLPTSSQALWLAHDRRAEALGLWASCRPPLWTDQLRQIIKRDECAAVDFDRGKPPVCDQFVELGAAQPRETTCFTNTDGERCKRRGFLMHLSFASARQLSASLRDSKCTNADGCGNRRIF